MHAWVPLLSTWNYDNIIGYGCLVTKSCLTFFH